MMRAVRAASIAHSEEGHVPRNSIRVAAADCPRRVDRACALGTVGTVGNVAYERLPVTAISTIRQACAVLRYRRVRQLDGRRRGPGRAVTSELIAFDDAARTRIKGRR